MHRRARRPRRLQQKLQYHPVDARRVRAVLPHSQGRGGVRRTLDAPDRAQPCARRGHLQRDRGGLPAHIDDAAGAAAAIPGASGRGGTAGVGWQGVALPPHRCGTRARCGHHAARKLGRSLARAGTRRLRPVGRPLGVEDGGRPRAVAATAGGGERRAAGLTAPTLLAAAAEAGGGGLHAPSGVRRRCRHRHRLPHADNDPPRPHEHRRGGARRSVAGGRGPPARARSHRLGWPA